MNILFYTVTVTAILSINYFFSFLVVTWAVIRGYYLAYDYLEKLILISQFTFLFNIYYETFAKIASTDLTRITKKINIYSAVGGIGAALFACFWFDLGIYMDISNNGLSEKVAIQSYFLIYNLAMGSFLSQLISDLFSEIERINNKVRKIHN